MTKGFTKEDRIRSIAGRTGLDVHTVRAVLDSEDEVIGEALKAGQRVYLDNIGTLVVREVKETQKYVPGKGTTTIPAHRKPKFKASSTLLERI